MASDVGGTGEIYEVRERVWEQSRSMGKQDRADSSLEKEGKRHLGNGRGYKV